MKTFLLPAVLVFVFSLNSLAQSQDIEAIKKLNQDWLNSMPKRDSSTLSRILSDDFILIAPNGARQTKKDNLSNLMSPNVEVRSVAIDSVNVRLLTPDVSVLSAWTHFVLRIDGKEMPGKNCYQDIYMKRKNQWVAVSAHVTLLSSRE